MAGFEVSTEAMTAEAARFQRRATASFLQGGAQQSFFTLGISGKRRGAIQADGCEFAVFVAPAWVMRLVPVR
jgi:hypothetical protein